MCTLLVSIVYYFSSRYQLVRGSFTLCSCVNSYVNVYHCDSGDSGIDTWEGYEAHSSVHVEKIVDANEYYE